MNIANATAPSPFLLTPEVVLHNFELLEDITSASEVVVHPYEILQALGAANTLIAMSEDSNFEASSSGSISDSASDGYDSDCYDSTSNIKINLYDPADEGRIGGFHNVFRRDIYEGFVVQSGEKFEGTVAFRCRFCKHLPYKARAKQSEVYPRTVEGLYRAHIRFNHDHFPACKFIPKEIKAKVARLKKSSPRGNKAAWVESALNKGLVNDVNGIVYCGVVN
ncbi:hypothetical protein ACHAXN_000917 [Cyclotella atomus]